MTRVPDLASARVQVGEFARRQRSSISAFWDPSQEIFSRTFEALSTDQAAAPAGDTTTIKRLTSTVTCLESLLEAPPWFEAADADWPNDRASEVLSQFMARSLKNDKKWVSDGGAWVYCRVRALGSSLRLTAGGSQWPAEDKAMAAKLVRQAWFSKYDGGGDFGLREATQDPTRRGAAKKLGEETSDQQYPANAFLTYWGLLAAEYGNGLTEATLIPAKSRAAALGWMRRNLSTQIAFRYSKSPHADPQQLLWSLTGLVRFGDPSALSNATSPEHALIVAGLRAFFEQQRDGTWARGAPLFSYRNAGNAYAYVYETLAELLSISTSREVDPLISETLTRLLSDYSQELVTALEYAEATGQRLTDDAFGWSSGHHPHRNAAESWATASVYRFAQSLRRLVGRWSCIDAGDKLGWRQPRGDIQRLRDRGSSWDIGSGTAGGFLATAFVHPIRREAIAIEGRARFLPDADEQILGEDQFRSAMLFGPPGTSKTTLVEAVAAAIGWRYVEITPAQFLDQGVDHVSSRADEIFRQVMELDHSVVLLDEIDELMRSRTDSAGTLERFFTTTMLPRLAKLWENGRVLFFVNTNGIAQVDPAIVRSQRFDAARLILPSGFESKKNYLAEKHNVTISVDEADITKSLLEPHKLGEPDKWLGWYALVRHDQLDTLAAAAPKGTPLDAAALVSSLTQIARELARLDWRPKDDKLEILAPGVVPEIPAVANQREFERRDARPTQVARLAACGVGASWLTDIASDGEWVDTGSQENVEHWAQKHGAQLTADGYLHVSGCQGTEPGQ